MRRARLLAVFDLILLVLAPATPAQPQVDDLVQGFADAVGLSWELVPASVAVDDPAGDLFTLDGGTATGPAHVDLLRTEEFGFTLDDEAFSAMFGEDGTLSCDLPEVSCPSYEVQSDPFTEGVYVIGMRMAAAPSVAGTETFSLAVLAFDDDWPTFQDPRPNSPFVGTNKAWRVDLTATGDSVRFLQVVTGPYEEFQTDARVLLTGDVAWFVIPSAEFPLQSTITGFRGHSFQEPAADVDGEAAAPTLTTPVFFSGALAAGPLATTTTVAVTTTTVTTPTSVSSPEETTSTGVAETTTVPAEATPTSAATDDQGGGVPPIVYIAIGLILLLLLVFFLRPKRNCQEEYEAWQAAQAVCDAARAAAERARDEAERLDAELDQLRKDYPPLGFDQSDEPTIEMDDGETMSPLDMALTQWDNKTRQPPVSEGTGGSRADAAAEAAAQRERLRDEYSRMKARETELMVEVSEAEAAAREAEAEARKACDAAEEAHQAYLRCMGEGAAPETGGASDGEEPKPEEAEPDEPKPEEPKPEEPKPDEPKPEEPRPPAPPPPAPPLPPPAPGGAGATEELPRQCEEGAQRETDVKVATFEMLRDRARAKITIGNDLTDDVEVFETLAIEAINEASRWAAARARIRGQEGVLYTIDISIQMEQVTARCSTLEICRNGRWDRMSFPQREVSEPEYFEKVTHRENLDHKTLRHVLQTARNEANRGGREELDRFCR